MLSPHHTWHCKRTNYFNATYDDKINECGFKFSVACQWYVLFKDEKDNLLQFAKVFSAKFLKSPIRQSLTPPPFYATRYTVLSKTKYEKTETPLAKQFIVKKNWNSSNRFVWT